MLNIANSNFLSFVTKVCDIQISSIMLEKGTVTTMTNAVFTQKLRRALVPMRKATIDALLLGSLIALILIYTQVVLRYPWLIIIAYVFVYSAALVIRLRKAAYDASVFIDREQTLDEANATLSSGRNFIGLLLFWGNHPHM
ncbi:MAG TPA: hypothetical protein VFQ36_07005 [Ktedonobacteraceae bacterium]|nr:hypothetical protein [Ktedonobacteraceae bacterium]